MTEDTNRGYTVPLPANPRDSKRLLIIVGLAVLAFLKMGFLIRNFIVNI